MSRVLLDGHGAYRSVAILAPMQIELDPIVARLGLVANGDVFTITRDGAEVSARVTEIGMAPGARAARRALDHGADLVMVVGIAGAVDDVPIGTVIQPERVIDRARDVGYEPWYPDDAEPVGIVSCGDDFIVDIATLAELRQQGVTALDMETAAIARECDERGVAWTVFRSISDRPGDGLIDPQVLAFTNPDGSADHDALAAYLRADPNRAARLAQLARDTERATVAAAEHAAILVRRLVGW